MESLLLDDNGDLVMIDGDMQLVNGEDEVVQTFRGLMRTNLDEWFLDPLMGFDYSVINGVKRIDEEVLHFSIQSVVDQMDELDRVENLQVTQARGDRQAAINCDVLTVDGLSFPYEEVF